MKYIKLQDQWIRRTHRSHKPYGKDVDENFKLCFIAAWEDETLDTWTKVCQYIADRTQKILLHGEQRQTYICAIVNGSTLETKTVDGVEIEDYGYLRVDDDAEVMRMNNLIKAAGWYLEWELSATLKDDTEIDDDPEADKYLLIIKSTCQDDKVLIAETDEVKKNL